MHTLPLEDVRQPLRVAPLGAFIGLEHEVPMTVAIQTKHQPAPLGWQQIAMRANHFPRVHQHFAGDEAVVEVECAGRLVQRTKSDPPAVAMQRNPGAIVPVVGRRLDRRIGHIELPQATQRVTRDPLPRRPLRVGCEVLQLAATAPVAHVMGTARVDPVRPRLEQQAQRRPGEALVQLHGDWLDEVARRGAGHEDGAAVRQPAHTVAARGNTLDAYRAIGGHRGAPRRPSETALSPQRLPQRLPAFVRLVHRSRPVPPQSQ